MAWYRTGRASSVVGSNVITGVGTLWGNNVFGIAPGQTLSIPGAGQVLQYEILAVDSDTKIRIATNATTTITNSEYAIVTTVANSYSALARQTSANLAVYEKLLSDWQDITTGTGNVTIIAPDGTSVVISSLTKLMSDVAGKASKSDLTGVVGTARNLKMITNGGSTTAAVTADELIVQSALGGLQYKLSSFNKAINLATTGAGGMSSGTVPVSGFVAIYAIYNPTTSVSALLAVSIGTSVAPEICGVALPSGYTASALVALRRISSSSFDFGYQTDRTVLIPPVSAITGSAIVTYQAVILSTLVPANATSVLCDGTSNITGTSNNSLILSPQAGPNGRIRFQSSTAIVIATTWCSIFNNIAAVYISTAGTGTAYSYAVVINGYTF